MITLLGLEDDVVSQQTLFEDDSSKPGKQALMRCFDTINERYGKNTMRTALHLPGTSPWSMRRKFLSPAYTTDITGIPDVF